MHHSIFVLLWAGNTLMGNILKGQQMIMYGKSLGQKLL
jgi:hypothetical protein